MYQNNRYQVEINVKLETGVYEFNDESATGKTRLCKVLREMQLIGEPVIGYTYDDYQLQVDLTQLVKKIHPQVILLDRYDMYNGAYDREIVEWSQYTIVLVDCKGRLLISKPSRICYIEMTKDNIEVEE